MNKIIYVLGCGYREPANVPANWTNKLYTHISYIEKIRNRLFDNNYIIIKRAHDFRCIFSFAHIPFARDASFCIRCRPLYYILCRLPAGLHINLSLHANKLHKSSRVWNGKEAENQLLIHCEGIVNGGSGNCGRPYNMRVVDELYRDVYKVVNKFKLNE